MKLMRLLQVLVILSWVAACTATKCAFIKFPNITGHEIKAEENTNLSVPFILDTKECRSSDKNFQIVVSKLGKDKEEDQCVLALNNRQCVSTGTECECPDDSGFYHFTKTVDRNDSAVWSWWTSSNEANRKQLTFNIRYPASITNLALPGRPNQAYEPGSQVHVTCDWENGNPPVQARLLDRHRKTLQNSTSGQLQYTFHTMGCQDAGLIRCEAPGAVDNKTETLLVKCPPQSGAEKQEVVEVTGEQVTVKLLVRAHTTTITGCTLKKLSPSTPAGGLPDLSDCAGYSNLTGTPPDLTLTVRLDIVSKEDKGQWRLELTNDAGTGHVDFQLIINSTGGQSSQSPLDSTSQPSGGGALNVPLMGGLIVGVNIGTVIIVTIVVLIIVRRARRERQQPQDEQQEQEMVPPPLPRAPDVDRPPQLPRRIRSQVYDDIYGEVPSGYLHLSYPPPRGHSSSDVPPPRPPRN